MTTPTRVANTTRASGKVAAVPDASAAEPPKKKSRKKLLLMVVAVVLIGAGGWYFMIGSKHPKAGPPKPGAVVTLDAQTLNLADGHFLKVQIALQTIAGKKDTIDTSKGDDLTIAEFTGRSMTSLATDQARNSAKADLLRKLQAAYPGLLMDAYYKVFVMQ